MCNVGISPFHKGPAMTPNPLDDVHETATPGPQAPRSDRPTPIGPGPARTINAATTSQPAAEQDAPPVDDGPNPDAPADAKLPPLTQIMDNLKTMGTGQGNRDRVAACYSKHKTIVPFLMALERGDEGVPSLTTKKVADFMAEVLKKRGKGK